MKLKVEFSEEELAHFSTEFQETINRLQMGVIDGLYQASHKVQEHLLTRVPRDTGALAQSASMGVANFDAADDIRAVVLSFGGENLNPKTGRPTKSYAVYNHEIFHVSHPNSYKWLALALREYGPEQLAVDIAQSLKALG